MSSSMSNAVSSSSSSAWDFGELCPPWPAAPPPPLSTPGVEEELVRTPLEEAGGRGRGGRTSNRPSIDMNEGGVNTSVPTKEEDLLLYYHKGGYTSAKSYKW